MKKTLLLRSSGEHLLELLLEQWYVDSWTMRDSCNVYNVHMGPDKMKKKLTV